MPNMKFYATGLVLIAALVVTVVAKPHSIPQRKSLIDVLLQAISDQSAEPQRPLSNNMRDAKLLQKMLGKYIHYNTSILTYNMQHYMSLIGSRTLCDHSAYYLHTMQCFV